MWGKIQEFLARNISAAALMMMTSTSETSEGEQRTNYTMNWVDLIVKDTFDQLMSEVVSGTKFHPSEEYNRDTRMKRKLESKIYDMINSYHSFCKLCEQHFYTSYDAGDVNSFFQDHLNTEYHRQLRTVACPPDNAPIFTWEEKYKTGMCNVCQMPGLIAFIHMLKSDPYKELVNHSCVCHPNSRNSNQAMLAKYNLLRKYCGLKIFRVKLLKSKQGEVFCLLCSEKLPWTMDQAKCHLTSNPHYKVFQEYLQNRFKLRPRDIVNGFNLELLTRTMILHNPPGITNSKSGDDRTVCLHQSNARHLLQEGFSPKRREAFLMNEENDLILDNRCLLCDIQANSDHLTTMTHLQKVQNMSLASFGSMRNYDLFCQNRIKRLKMLEVLEKLDSGADEGEKKTGDANHIRSLFEERRRLVSLVFTMTNDDTAYCHVCDESIKVAQEIEHVNSDKHMHFQKLWNEIGQDLKNPKYTEPFQSFKSQLFCHLCGLIFNPGKLFYHITGRTHVAGWEWYRSLNVNISISSAVYLKRDLTCICSICKKVILGVWSKVDLKKPLEHWPCPKLREAQRNSAESVSDAKKLETENEKLEEVVESLVGVLQDKLMQAAYDRAVSLADQMNDLSLVEPKAFEEPQLVETEPPELSDSESEGSGTEWNRPEDNDSPTTSGAGAEALNLPTRAAGSLPIAPSTSAQREIAGIKNIQRKPKSKWEREVLIATGFHKDQRNPKYLFKVFRAVGEVICVAIKKSEALVVFTELGLAQKVARNAEFANKYNITLSASKKKIYKAEVQLPPLLDEEFVQLFLNPNSLVDSMVKFSVEANKTMESVNERRKESKICKAIEKTVAGTYPNAKCYPFGSRLSGLTLDNSDLDIFIDCGKMYYGFLNSSSVAQKKILADLDTALRKNKDFLVLNMVSKARVPIISFQHLPTKLRCDLSFKNALSVHNTQLIRDLLSLDWRVRPLVLLLKRWAKSNGLHGSPEFSSYALSMLVIFYLEQLEYPILPTVEMLQDTAGLPRRTIAGWDCTISPNIQFLKDNDNEDTLPQLLVGLFEYYANFDYDANVISPLTGQPLPRELFSNERINDLPWCYRRQILNLPMPLDRLVSRDFCICIIDPFDYSHVLTKSFGEQKLQAFIHYCNVSAAYLKKGIEDMK